MNPRTLLDHLWLLYDADNGGAGGGGAQGSPPANSNDDPPGQGSGGSTPPANNPQGGEPGGSSNDAGGSLPPDVREALTNLIDRAGNAQAAAALLFQENHDLRQRNRDLNSRIENATILDADQAQQWQRYRDLGDPDQLAQTIRQQEIAEIASLAGYNPAVLARLDRAADEPIRFEIREVEQDGENRRRAFVITGDGDNDRQSLEEFAAQEWRDFMPALQPTGGQGSANGGQGTPYPRQTSGAPPRTDLVSTFISERNKAAEDRTNPLQS